MYEKFKSDLQTLSEKLKEMNYANALYAAMCNVIWVDKVSKKEVGYSWRCAGGLVASIRDIGEEYINFYCNGNEGSVRADILKDLSRLGWEPKSYDEESI